VQVASARAANNIGRERVLIETCGKEMVMCDQQYPGAEQCHATSRRRNIGIPYETAPPETPPLKRRRPPVSLLHLRARAISKSGERGATTAFGWPGSVLLFLLVGHCHCAWMMARLTSVARGGGGGILGAAAPSFPPVGTPPPPRL